MTRAKHLPRFSQPSALREIDPACLLDLIQPFAEFLANHRVALPSDPASLDLERLGVVLLQPQVDMPFELVDALVHIDEMSTPSGMEILLTEARHRGLKMPEDADLAPADVAVRMWLTDPELLRRKHAEHVVLRRRSFESFLPRQGAARLRMAQVEQTLRQLEADIQKWFLERGRGRGACLLVIERDDELQLVVRHGGPYRREGCITEGKPSSVQFRPMEFHFIILKRGSCELRVNCKNKGEAKLYREAIGNRFFGRPDFYDEKSCKYTLEPLRQFGRRSLVCSDVPGIERVRLTELSMQLGGPFGRRRIEQADDVLLALENAGERIPEGALLTKGKLEITFAGCSKPRTVTIGSRNRAQYTRDGDAALVEDFLCKRGFVLGDDREAVACA